MSNKDVRRPAAGAGAAFAKKHAEYFAQFYDWDGKPREDGDLGPDEQFLSTMPTEMHDEWVKTGNRIRADFQESFEADHGPIDTLGALSSLDTCTHFLTQLVRLTSSIISTVDFRSLRQIVASDTHLPNNMRIALKSVGVDADELLSEEKEPLENSVPEKEWRKRPRGARHPLMVLIGFALQATRLIQKISAGTNPDAQNLKDRRVSSEGKGTPKMPKMPNIPDIPDIPGVPGM